MATGAEINYRLANSLCLSCGERRIYTKPYVCPRCERLAREAKGKK